MVTSYSKAAAQMIEIIAECGVNWKDLTEAKTLIWQAYDCGCNAVKFQAYSVDAVFPDGKILGRRDWWENVKAIEMTEPLLRELADYAKSLGLEFLCSAFDLERLSWVNRVSKRHKVASLLNKNIEYIDAVASTGKEVLISSIACDSNRRPPYYRRWMKWLYCIPKYPTPHGELSLGRVDFSDATGFHGFSDHTIGVEAAMIAISRGARIVEKHFTLDKTDDSGPDHCCSAEPREMKQLVEFARKAENIL